MRNNEDQNGEGGKEEVRAAKKRFIHDCDEGCTESLRRQKSQRIKDLPKLKVPQTSMPHSISQTTLESPTIRSSGSSSPQSESTTSAHRADLAYSDESDEGSSGVVVVDERNLFDRKQAHAAILRSHKKYERGCRCGRTRCLKQYCQCFRADTRCSKDCVCDNCYNDGKHEKERAQAIRNIRVNHPAAFKGTRLELEGSLVRLPEGTVKTVRGCRCKRSRCQKKYCECFGASLKCNANCLCENCRNGNEDKGEGVLPTALAELTRVHTTCSQPPSFVGSEMIPRVISGAASHHPNTTALRPQIVEILPETSSKSSLCTPPAVPASRDSSISSNFEPHSLDRDGNMEEDNGEEFERMLAAQLASSFTPRYTAGLTSGSPFHESRPVARQARQGWGDDSPDTKGQPWEGPSWTPTAALSEWAAASPKHANGRPGKTYGAPAASYAPESGADAANALNLTSGESLLRSGTPPCTPLADLPRTISGLLLSGAGSGGDRGLSLLQPMSWGLTLERNNSHDMVF